MTARLGESPCRLPKLNMTCQEEEDGDTNPQPLEASICFHHIWSEPLHPGRDCSGRAKKVFLSKDAVDQSYFCLLLPTKTLNLIKFKYANDDGTTMIFGATEKIPALDAEPLDGLNMLLVLDLTGSLVLYSGTSRVGKVLLPPSTATLLSQEISALAIDSKPGTPVPGGGVDLCLSTPIQTSTRPLAFPPLSTVRRQETLDKNFDFLSPVNTDLGSTTLVGVRDACHRQVGIKFVR